MNYKILVVEDDKNIREFLELSLKRREYSVKSTGDGAVALKLTKESKFDLVILDLSIENISGETVCSVLKETIPSLPIIILTAKNKTEDIVRGLEIGADDYISKPFELEELLARIRTQLKQKSSPVLVLDSLEVDTSTLKVKRGNKMIDLTATEFKLLEYLMINQGIVLSREAILDHIWLYSVNIETRVVDVYIGHLRKKIDKEFNKKLIQCVRGFGYTIRA